MSNAEFEARMRSAARSAGRTVLLIGVICVMMGVGLVSCAGLGLDPEMVGYSTGQWVAFGLVTAFFLGVGLLLALVSVVQVPRRGLELMERVLHRPETIQRVWMQLARARANPNREAGQLGVGASVCVITVDNRHIQLPLPRADARALFDAVVARLPNAELGPP